MYKFSNVSPCLRRGGLYATDPPLPHIEVQKKENNCFVQQKEQKPKCSCMKK